MRTPVKRSKSDIKTKPESELSLVHFQILNRIRWTIHNEINSSQTTF